MRTRVHVCVAAGDARMAAPLLERLADPLTGLITAGPVGKGAFHGPDADEVRGLLTDRIRQAEVLACLIGPQAHHDRWVDWEVMTALEYERGVVAIRLRSGIHDFMPRAIRHSGAPVVDLHIGSVVAALERLAFAARLRGAGNK